MRSLQNGTYKSPRRASPDYSPRPPSPRDDKIKPPPVQNTAFGESTYARGGHGIFGQPKVVYQECTMVKHDYLMTNVSSLLVADAVLFCVKKNCKFKTGKFLSTPLCDFVFQIVKLSLTKLLLLCQPNQFLLPYLTE